MDGHLHSASRSRNTAARGRHGAEAVVPARPCRTPPPVGVTSRAENPSSPVNCRRRQQRAWLPSRRDTPLAVLARAAYTAALLPRPEGPTAETQNDQVNCDGVRTRAAHAPSNGRRYPSTPRPQRPPLQLTRQSLQRRRVPDATRRASVFMVLQGHGEALFFTATTTATGARRHCWCVLFWQRLVALNAGRAPWLEIREEDEGDRQFHHHKFTTMPAGGLSTSE